MVCITHKRWQAMGHWSPLVVSMEMPATLTVLTKHKTFEPFRKMGSIFSVLSIPLSLRLSRSILTSNLLSKSEVLSPSSDPVLKRTELKSFHLAAGQPKPRIRNQPSRNLLKQSFQGLHRLISTHWLESIYLMDDSESD